MKKILMIIALCTAGTVATMAQKTTVKFQDTQARLLDVNSNAYVKPLTVELQVLTNKRISDVIPLTKDQVEIEMKGDLTNIRSFAVYRASQLHDCDVIVAATFNVRTNAAGDGYEVNIIGYPANFVNWKTATQADYEWIKMEKTITTAERTKIAAAVK
ncbi:MAG: hypothetical protein IJ710_02685 [Prevotella sp.]|nr:hypothetical protein [Prevotella sp.]